MKEYNDSDSLGNITANLTNGVGNSTIYGSVDSQGLHPLYIALYVSAAVMILPGLAGNGLIIAAVTKVRTLRNATNYLISSLAVADLIMMFVMVSFLLYDGLELSLPDSMRFWLFPSLDIAIASASILSLASVSFDRALAVTRPLHYNQLFNRRRALHVIIVIWTYVIFIFTLSILRSEFFSTAYQYTVLTIAYLIGFIIPCVVVAISYAVILCVTLRIIKMSRRLEKSLRVNSLDGESRKKQGKKKLQLYEAKVAVNLMLILVPFLVGWGFYFGTFWSEHINSDAARRPPIYEWFLLVIPWFISSINPVVYILMTKVLRHGCRKLICSYFKRRRNQDSRNRSSSFHKMLIFGRRQSSFETQSKSLINLWSRGKRSGSADTILLRLNRSSFLVSKDNGKVAEKEEEQAS